MSGAASAFVSVQIELVAKCSAELNSTLPRLYLTLTAPILSLTNFIKVANQFLSFLFGGIE